MSSSGRAAGSTTGALAAVQNGVLLATDAAISAISITAGTGALAFTLAAANQFLFIKSAAGVLSGVVFAGGAQTPAALTPATPNYAVIGVEVDVNGVIALVKGADTATQLNTGALIASNTPATTAGKLRLWDFAIQNNAGSFRFGDQTTVASQGVNYIDRRPWAKGFYFDKFVGATTYTTTSAFFTALDTANFRARVECSGVPLQIRMTGQATAATAIAVLAASIDNDITLGSGTWTNATRNNAQALGQPSTIYSAGVLYAWTFAAPTAGSHLITIVWCSNAGTATLGGTAPQNVGMIIDEVLNQNTANGTA